MIDKHLKKTKIHFSIGTFLLLATIISGVSIMRDSEYLNKDYYKNNLIYYRYSFSFAKKCESISWSDIFLNKKGQCLSSEIINNQVAKSIPVLLYHGVLDTIDSTDTTNISYNNFADQMIALKENGWQTISLDDLLLFTQGKKEITEKSFVLTFDDGRKDSYYPVDSILRALNFNATMFVIGDSLQDNGGRFYLNRKELKKMSLSGNWEIQPHTYAGHNEIIIDNKNKKGHFYGNKIWLDIEKRLENDEEYANRVRNDILLAKNSVVNIVNSGNLSFFAFPFGDFGQESLNFKGAEDMLIREIENIYALAFYQANEFNYPENQKLIKRIGINDKINKDDLLTILNLGSEKNIPFAESNFENNTNWKNGWGINEVINGNMIIKSNAISTGSSSVLKGSRFWDNYYFTAIVNWKKGSNLVLLVRYIDDSNYLACNYSDKILRIEKVTDGNKVISEEKIDFNFSKHNLELGVRINGLNIDCLLGNKVIASSQIQTNLLYKGGIGFKTWDKIINNSEVEILEVSVNNN